MRRLWRLCESEQSLLLRGFALTAVAGLLATIPAFVAIVAVSQLSAGDLARGDVVPIAVVCTGSLVARYLAARYANRLLWVVAYEITGRIRHRLLDQALSMPTMSNAKPARC